METQTKLIIGAVGVVTVVAILMAKKVAQGLNAVNPLNHDNVIAGTVNDLGSYLFDGPTDMGKNADGSWTLGGAIYDITHPTVTKEIRTINKPVGVTAPDPGPDGAGMWG